MKIIRRVGTWVVVRCNIPDQVTTAVGKVYPRERLFLAPGHCCTHVVQIFPMWFSLPVGFYWFLRRKRWGNPGILSVARRHSSWARWSFPSLHWYVMSPLFTNTAAPTHALPCRLSLRSPSTPPLSSSRFFLQLCSARLLRTTVGRVIYSLRMYRSVPCAQVVSVGNRHIFVQLFVFWKKKTTKNIIYDLITLFATPALLWVRLQKKRGMETPRIPGLHGRIVLHARACAV